MVQNLWREQQKWERLTRVLGREGTDYRILGRIYVEVVQEVLLYGSETWVMTPHIGGALSGSHHRVTRRLMGRRPQRESDRRWIYPPLTEVMEEACLQEVDTYVYLCHNTF